MKGPITRRDYAGPSDFGALLRFTQRIWTPDSRWHLGDIAWDIDPAGDPEDAMAIWEQAGQIVAFGWLSRPDQLAMLVDPRSADTLVDAVVDWAAAVAGVPVSVGVLDTERELIDPLVRRGLAPDRSGHFFLNMQRSLAGLPPIPELPAGFRLRPVTPDDLPARATIHRAVWGPRLTDNLYAALANRWPYRLSDDWVAVAPSGEFAAFILGWYDEVARVGEFEPVGTLSEYRRMGLSRALGIALMHAWRDAGAAGALVYARGDDDYPVPRQVYGALGFQVHGRVVKYR